jgi:hypothetical protein
MQFYSSLLQQAFLIFEPDQNPYLIPLKFSRKFFPSSLFLAIILLHGTIKTLKT